MPEPQLQNLMTYTVFHIGVYVSLAAALIGAGIFGKVDSWWMKSAMICFVVAGICGAVIGSNIPHFSDFATFSAAKLGPWDWHLMPFTTWARVEHFAFWLGLALVGLPYLYWGKAAFPKSS